MTGPVVTGTEVTGTRMPRLVVVDDDGDLAQELAGLFTDVGYEVTGVATAAREGINLVERTRPDVVLMDIRMEGMSGTEAASVLRRSHPGVPVVLLSAYSDEGIVKAAREAHVAAYLVKGCTARELLSTVGTVVKDSRARYQAANDPRSHAT
jgi:CheY-like chemotaxis protein